jgi:hypothetical protein
MPGAISLAAPNAPTTSQFEEVAKSLWPSGRRPIPGSTCYVGILTGPIVRGDYEKVLRLYRANHPFLNTFLLVSPGGDVDAALKIGRLFRRYLITASAPLTPPPGGAPQLPWLVGGKLQDLCQGQDCICASACALIWFGAVGRSGRVGLHRPHTEDPTFRNLSPAEASVAYRQILDGVHRYLDEMEAPNPMIDAMIGTSSADMTWVDAGKYNLERPPSIAEWEDASCKAFSAQEMASFMSLSNKEPKTQSDQSLLGTLWNKFQSQQNCKSQLRSSNRDRLPAP